MADFRSIRRVDFPREILPSDLERWADEIPVYPDADPLNPEWEKTPVRELDLGEFGRIYLKDESVNPTGVHKDRQAWEAVALYRDLARLKLLSGALPPFLVPRITLLTYGNAGAALAHALEAHDLPPPQLLVPSGLSDAKMTHLRALRADVYAAGFGRKLEPLDILTLTDNEYGLEFTSSLATRLEEISYDWLAHECFNEQPDEIYLPYGSGRLMENLLRWQERNLRRYMSDGEGDPRLLLPAALLAKVSVLGAEPKSRTSIADKLPAPYKPFLAFEHTDHTALRSFSLTGPLSAVHRVREEYIVHACDLLSAQGVSFEPSGAAGLALYLQRVDEGHSHPLDGKKRLIVNTGKGLLTSQLEIEY